VSAPIEVAVEGRFASLTIARPPLNILDVETLAALGEAVAGLERLPDLAAVFLRGAGERAFSAGVSIADHAPDRIGAMLDSLHGSIRRLRALPGISVAAVHGYCLGGGMELALSCDLAVAEEGATFGQPEIELGCFAPVAAALFPARIGAARTLDLLLTGRRLSAAEAAGWGLVSRVAPAGGLDALLAELRGRWEALSAPVLRLTKRAVGAGATAASDPFGAALAETERLYVEELCPLEDMAEGVAAFLGKRPPLWTHR
jgi:cyclohexa-1,5-dienecarbonyl-CoA hydratase